MTSIKIAIKKFPDFSAYDFFNIIQSYFSFMTHYFVFYCVSQVVRSSALPVFSLLFHIAECARNAIFRLRLVECHGTAHAKIETYFVRLE